MTTIEINALDRDLSAAFHGGERLTRELRLTDEEADYLRKSCPHAHLIPLPGPKSEKAWYQVQMASAIAN